jgi:type I restriction enzyme S subunit
MAESGDVTMKRRKIKDLIADGAILEIQDGNHGEKHPTSADYVDAGIPFLMARDFRGGQLDLAGACKIPKSLADSLRIGFARANDVLLTHKGSVGLVAIVPKVPDYVMLTPQITYYRTNPSKLLNTYLKYALQAPFFRQQLDSFSAQSTRPYIGITAQKELEIDIPSLPMQRRIADMLSAYDELIENNQKRIRTLEQMAYSLYREWFVLFRFPGHEKFKRVDSILGEIPEGWEVVSLEDVCERITDGSHSSPKSVEEGLPMASSKDMGDWGLNLETCRFIAREDFDQLVRNGCKRILTDQYARRITAGPFSRVYGHTAHCRGGAYPRSLW